MTPAGSFHFAAYEAEYEAVLARARHAVAGFPPSLRSLEEPLLPGWSEGSFSRIVALLPYWVADLLDKTQFPKNSLHSLRPDQTGALALAMLLGWWSNLIQDGLLDGEMEPAELLPLSMALHASAVRLLAQLLPGHESFWEAFERLSLASSEACAWEQEHRLARFESPGACDLELVDLDRLADRSSLLQLAPLAQFALLGLDQEHPLCTALCETLRYYTIARQIGDDRSDWVQDLQDGRLNYVSSRLLRRMRENGATESFADLDIERMMGYYLYDDELLASIQLEAVEACARATQCIAPYDSRPLDSLVSEMAQQLERSYRASLESRRRLQAAFTLAKPG